MEIESGPADCCAVQHFLHCDFVDRLLLHQRDQRITQQAARTPDAQVRLAPLLVISPLLGKPYGYRRALIVGHRPPFCSATRPISLTAIDTASLHRYSADSTAALGSTRKKGRDHESKSVTCNRQYVVDCARNAG